MIEVGSQRSINGFKCPITASEESFLVSQIALDPNHSSSRRPTIFRNPPRTLGTMSAGRLIGICSAWSRASSASAPRCGGLDIADENKDLNAAAFRHGVLLDELHSWSGKESNLYATTLRMFSLCDDYGYDTFDFDSDGIGGLCVAVQSESTKSAAWNADRLHVFTHIAAAVPYGTLIGSSARLGATERRVFPES